MPAGGPEYQVQKYISEGLSVREVDGGDSGWTYSTAKWYVNFDPREDQNRTALPAADGGADAAVAHTADAEIQRCHRFDGGAVHMVSLLSADAVPPAAVGVYRPVHGKVRGLPPEPWNRYAVDHPCGTVSTGDHQ